MDVVSSLPPHLLRFKCQEVDFRGRDEHGTTLQLHLKFNEVGANISEEAEPIGPRLVRELFKAFESPLVTEAKTRFKTELSDAECGKAVRCSQLRVPV